MRGGQNAGKSTRGYLWCPYTWLFLLIEYNASIFSVLVRYVIARVCVCVCVRAHNIHMYTQCPMLKKVLRLLECRNQPRKNSSYVSPSN